MSSAISWRKWLLIIISIGVGKSLVGYYLFDKVRLPALRVACESIVWTKEVRPEQGCVSIDRFTSRTTVCRRNKPSNRKKEIHRFESPGIRAGFTIDTDLSTDFGVTHSVFSPGIQVWYINVVHNPRFTMPVDFQRDFLITWQSFDLEGQPL